MKNTKIKKLTKKEMKVLFGGSKRPGLVTYSNIKL